MSYLLVLLVLAVVAMSLAFSGGAVIVAVPLAIVIIAGYAAFDFNRRRKQAKSLQGHREQAQTKDVEFTERDKETLVSE